MQTCSCRLFLLSTLLFASGCFQVDHGPTHYKLEGDKMTFYKGSSEFDMNGWKTTRYDNYTDQGQIIRRTTQHMSNDRFGMIIRVIYNLDDKTGFFPLSEVRFLEGEKQRSPKDPAVYAIDRALIKKE